MLPASLSLEYCHICQSSSSFYDCQFQCRNPCLFSHPNIKWKTVLSAVLHSWHRYSTWPITLPHSATSLLPTHRPIYLKTVLEFHLSLQLMPNLWRKHSLLHRSCYSTRPPPSMTSDNRKSLHHAVPIVSACAFPYTPTWAFTHPNCTAKPCLQRRPTSLTIFTRS